jgi:predicted flavoprotein YhiN
MPQHQPSEQELLKTVLQPLLEDFQYWFSRSRTLLETETITFLSKEQQSDLLERVKHAQQEVSTAQMLFQATNGQVGVETATLVPWHRLLSECWHVGMRWRAGASTALEKENSND